MTPNAEDQDFKARLARVEALTRELDRTADPAVRAAVKELIQSVMDLHGAAVNRMMEIIHEQPHGAATIDALGDDSLTGSLLILYGLHPQDTSTRVERAMERLIPTFRRNGADVELLGVENGVVSLRISGVETGTTGRALKSAIEEQIYALAPDVTRLEGLSGLATSDLVTIEALVGAGKNGA